MSKLFTKPPTLYWIAPDAKSYANKCISITIALLFIAIGVVHPTYGEHKPDVTIKESKLLEITCKTDTVLYLPITGSGTDSLFVSDLLLSASNPENIDTSYLSQYAFTCQNLNDTVQVIITVVDNQAIQSICTTRVVIFTDTIDISAKTSICGNDSLFLFADTTLINAANASEFQYSWTGPAGYNSEERNPIILNARAAQSGLYFLSLTGPSGCTQEDSVMVVTIDPPAAPPLRVSSTQICDNEVLILLTDEVVGNNVRYLWYEGEPANRTLIGNTAVPSFGLGGISQGLHTYFVEYILDDCTSLPSDLVSITVGRAPTAETKDSFVELCVGDDILLGTPNSGPGLEYLWNGPNGFTSNLPNPAAIEKVTINNAGIYTLIITQDGCSSLPASTLVTVNPTPETPNLISNSPLCIDGEIMLSSSITTAENYLWFFDEMRFNSNSPSQVVTPISSGQFEASLIISVNNCPSDTSAIEVIQVDEIPIATASNNSPACANATLELSVNDIENASYFWTGPNDFSSTEQNPNLPIVAGQYFVAISTPGGCETKDSTTVVVSSSPVIVDILADAPSCVTGTENITLSATISPVDDGTYTYFWTGPNGFESSLSSPVIPNATSSINGSYQLIVLNGTGCGSRPLAKTVEVMDLPPTPNIDASEQVCENQALILTTTLTEGSSVGYQWTLPNGDVVVTQIPSYEIANATTDDSGNYQVKVVVNGCTSNPSVPVRIMVISQPLPPAISGDSIYCSGETLVLATTNVIGTTFSWSTPIGNRMGSSFIESNVEVSASGTFILNSEKDGCTSEASEIVVQIKQTPQTPSLINDGPKCVDDTIRLSTTMSNVDLYIWSSPNFQDNTTTEPFLDIFGPTLIQGPWSLAVEANGCRSENSLPSQVLVSPTPPTPLLIANVNPLCEEAELVIETQALGDGTVYQWMTPTGFETTTVPFLSKPNADLDDAGAYNMFSIINGCASDTSEILNIEISPIPNLPLIYSNTPVCEGSIITLDTDSIESTDARYFWTGPAGFDSRLRNPSLNASPNLDGLYSLFVVVDRCTSQVATQQVQVIDLDKPPLVQNDGPICLDDVGTSIRLRVDPGTAINGATYSWYHADNPEVIVCGPTTNLICSISDLSDFEVGFEEFFLIANTSFCQTEPSLSTVVELQSRPNDKANAGEDIQVCNSNITTLNAEINNNGIPGFWQQTCGPAASIGNANAPVSTVSGLLPGQEYCFTWTLDFGSCGSDSDDMTIIVDETGETAATCERIVICNERIVVLCGEPSMEGNAGKWTQPEAQEALGVTIIDENLASSLVTGLIPGNTFIFTWSLENGGCDNISTADLIVEVNQADDIVAEVVEDFSACGNGSVEICASDITVGQGFWTSLSGSVDILTPDASCSLVTGLEPGNFRFLWTVIDDVCNQFASDTLTIQYNQIPQANPDLVIVPFAGSITFDVTQNDDVEGVFSVSLIDQPSNGSIESGDIGEYTYQVDPGFSGEETIRYELCSDICPDDCQQAMIVINVGETNCAFPTVVTPNGDGINDLLIIPCLSGNEFSDNTLSIFNQWGDEVFYAAPYQNTWDAVYQGQNLPEGTYFFVIEYGNGLDSESGFILLKR